jgi:hypothetical protein
MRWRKYGRVYVPDGGQAWAQHHAFPPTPLARPDGSLRLYMAFCDERTVGRVGWVDVDPEQPSRILGVAAEPVLDIGHPGAFDENGVLPTSVIRVGDEIWMYYVGYQLGHQVTYFQFEGLAVSRDGGDRFERHQRVPVIDRSDAELVNRTSAFVRQTPVGDFEMWYVAGSDWTTVDGKPLPVYDMRYLRSADGVIWPPTGEICIELEGEDEHALGRPWVITRDDGSREMFYSVRTRSKDYRIGYATSDDGRNWTRRDADVGIDVSADGWDSESIAYASVVDLAGGRTMFYNGNERGRTGFGYAVLEPD